MYDARDIVNNDLSNYCASTFITFWNNGLSHSIKAGTANYMLLVTYKLTYI